MSGPRVSGEFRVLGAEPLSPSPCGAPRWAYCLLLHGRVYRCRTLAGAPWAYALPSLPEALRAVLAKRGDGWIMVEGEAA